MYPPMPSEPYQPPTYITSIIPSSDTRNKTKLWWMAQNTGYPIPQINHSVPPKQLSGHHPHITYIPISLLDTLPTCRHDGQAPLCIIPVQFHTCGGLIRLHPICEYHPPHLPPTQPPHLHGHNWLHKFLLCGESCPPCFHTTTLWWTNPILNQHPLYVHQPRCGNKGNKYQNPHTTYSWSSSV